MPENYEWTGEGFRPLVRTAGEPMWWYGGCLRYGQAIASNKRILIKNAPRTLALTAFTQAVPSRLIVHLVNSVRDEILHPVADVPESRDVVLKIRVSSEPRKVVSLAGDHFTHQSLDEGIITLTFANIRYYTVIAVEF